MEGISIGDKSDQNNRDEYIGVTVEVLRNK